MRRFVLVALCLLAVGCGDDSPIAPSNADVSGTWRGTPTFSGLSSQLQLTFSQNDRDEVTGTWAWTVDGATAGGPLGGLVNEKSLSVSLSPSNPTDQCRLQITATVAGTRMTGTYGGLTCPTTIGGAVDLTKQ